MLERQALRRVSTGTAGRRRRFLLKRVLVGGMRSLWSFGEWWCAYADSNLVLLEAGHQHLPRSMHVVHPDHSPASTRRAVPGSFTSDHKRRATYSSNSTRLGYMLRTSLHHVPHSLICFGYVARELHFRWRQQRLAHARLSFERVSCVPAAPLWTTHGSMTGSRGPAILLLGGSTATAAAGEDAEVCCLKFEISGGALSPLVVLRL